MNRPPDFFKQLCVVGEIQAFFHRQLHCRQILRFPENLGCLDLEKPAAVRCCQNRSIFRFFDGVLDPYTQNGRTVPFGVRNDFLDLYFFHQWPGAVMDGDKFCLFRYLPDPSEDGLLSGFSPIRHHPDGQPRQYFPIRFFRLFSGDHKDLSYFRDP